MYDELGGKRSNAERLVNEFRYVSKHNVLTANLEKTQIQVTGKVATECGNERIVGLKRTKGNFRIKAGWPKANSDCQIIPAVKLSHV